MKTTIFILMLFVANFAIAQQQKTTPKKTTTSNYKPKTSTQKSTTTRTPVRNTAPRPAVSPVVASVPVKQGTLPSGAVYHDPKDINDANLLTKEIITMGKIAEVFHNKDTRYFINLERPFPDNDVTIAFDPTTYKGNWQRFERSVGKSFIFYGKITEFNTDKLRYGFDIYSDEQVLELK
jgi:hypothetical protein